ncbi:MAG: lipid IV(A) 3-deoxy-D-manno-octulosonic acid transferase [Pseudomonadota bacterium]
MRIFYSLFFYTLVPLILLRLLLRSRRAPAYRRRIRERFGFITPISAPCLWVHAVSVGEVQAARPLLAQLQQRYPDHTLLVTTMTPTGAERVVALGGGIEHRYLPYDLPDAVQRFLRRTRPKACLIMETELWPNLLHYCDRAGIPVVLVNARMSERSARGYARLGGFTRNALSKLAMIAAQTTADRERLINLGAAPTQVQVTGSLKFDFAPPEDIAQHAAVLRAQWGNVRKIWIAASTHRGEDELILQAHARVKQAVPEALLVLVPRHPERFNEVAALCQGRGYQLVRRSAQRACEAATDIFLGDSMGELMLFFAAADVAFVGGSLVPTGGHNLLEPASLGKPVLTGPHMFNFTEIHRQLLEAGASREVRDPAALAEAVIELLRNEAERQRMGENGRRLVEQNRGALGRVMVLVEAVLGAGG